MELFVDTETTGKITNYRAHPRESEFFPHLVQIGWITYINGIKFRECEYVIYPEGFEISEEVSKIHGITQEYAVNNGLFLRSILAAFLADASYADVIIGHNIEFDMKVISAELYREFYKNPIEDKPTICTMKSGTDFCKLINPHYGAGGYKYPKLAELYQKLFDRPMGEAHTALKDISNTAECYFEMKSRGIIKAVDRV